MASTEKPKDVANNDGGETTTATARPAVAAAAADDESDYEELDGELPCYGAHYT